MVYEPETQLCHLVLTSKAVKSVVHRRRIEKQRRSSWIVSSWLWCKSFIEGHCGGLKAIQAEKTWVGVNQF